MTTLRVSRRAGAIALVATAAAAAILPLPSSLVERWYSSLIYPAMQRVLTPASNLAPFALFDALCIAAICAAAVALYRSVRRHGWKHGLLRAAAAGVVAGASIYLVFLVMWGLNYRRVPFDRKVVFDAARIDRKAARALGDANAATLNRLHAHAHVATLSRESLAASFRDTLRRLGARIDTAPGDPKPTLLGAYFHQTSIVGMTNPFLLETLIAPDLLEVERPFVIAHEWAHLAGYADESEANYVAWLTCRHGDALAQYSAALTMIGYAAPSRPLREALDVGPRIDLWAMSYRYARTSPTVRRAARRSYDAYLKANRVEKGVESYDAVVQLILGTETDAEGYPRRR